MMKMKDTTELLDQLDKAERAEIEKVKAWENYKEKEKTHFEGVGFS